MPLYEFEHLVRLSASQKSSIAEAVTHWHTTTFKAPRYIVGCRFIDVSHGPLSDLYIGGVPKQQNRLFVSLRSGTGRTAEQLEGMTNSLLGIWNSVVGSSKDAELRAVFVQGVIDSAFEGGFMLPMVSSIRRPASMFNNRLTVFDQPGKFEQWVKDHTADFRKLADAGDDDFIGLIKEIAERPEFQD